MFTAGADVLGCYKSDRLWFLLNDRNQSLSDLPISTSAGSCCQHMGQITNANIRVLGPPSVNALGVKFVSVKSCNFRRILFRFF